MSKPGRLDSEKEGEKITCPRDQETTNGYHENDGVSTLVRELAFGIVVCWY